MPSIIQTAVSQIDAVLASSPSTEETVTLLCAALKRLSPPDSVYLDRMEKVLNMKFAGVADRGFRYSTIISDLRNVLRALPSRLRCRKAPILRGTCSRSPFL